MLNRGLVKPFKTYKEQVQLLISRGLIVPDIEEAERILAQTNYYRFSAYSLTLRKDDQFYPSVSFDDIYELYRFDSSFRHIILKYTIIAETAFRAYISYYHAEKYGPLGYMESSNFEDVVRFSRFINELNKDIERSDDLFVSHHKKDLNSVFPIWVSIETLSFGALSKFFKNMKKSDRNNISKRYFKYGREYVENWLQCCAYCRNVAAHGGRFYNRSLMSCPVKLDRKKCAGVSNISAFAFVIAISRLLPSEEMKMSFIDSIEKCFAKHPFALKKHMGFPENWKQFL